jgi:UDP-GlcNAc3NAcA epimerase
VDPASGTGRGLLVKELSILTVVGARPEFIKLAPLSAALSGWKGEPRLVETVVHTGQHYDPDMSAGFFAELGLPEPIHLGVGSGSHGAQTGRMLELLDPLITSRRPGLVLVYGDTNSTLAGALAAAKLGAPVAHVEAGLRSWNPSMPEEINRRLTDHLASVLLCPSSHSQGNLAAEGITRGVHVTGDVNLDALLQHLPGRAEQDAVLADLGLEAGAFAVATVHRAENTDDPQRLESIVAALGRLAASGVPVVFPMHPRTRERLGRAGLPPGGAARPPVGFRQLLCLEARARVGLTDSGGVQKELFWLGTPCVTLREETEWVETLEEGRNVLAGSDPEAIIGAALGSPGRFDPAPPVYGSGQAAAAITETLVAWAREG